jgi:hypothetical protein
VADTKMKDLALISNRDAREALHFKPDEAQRVIAAAKETLSHHFYGSVRNWSSSL